MKLFLMSGYVVLSVGVLLAGNVVAQQGNVTPVYRGADHVSSTTTPSNPSSAIPPITLPQDSAAAHINKAKEYLKQMNLDQAFEEYGKALVVNPNNFEVYLQRGDIYVAKSSFEQALQEYSKAIELNPNSSNTYNRRGSIYMTVGNLVRAIQDFDKVLSFNPNDAQTYYARGITYATAGGYNNALQDFKKACDLGHSEACSSFNSLMQQ